MKQNRGIGEAGKRGAIQNLSFRCCLLLFSSSMMGMLGELFSPVHRFSVSPDHSCGGYALDAIDWYDPRKAEPGNGDGEKRSSEDERNWTAEVPESRFFTFAVSPLLRFSGSSFSLCLDDQILHLSIFAKTNGMEHAAQGSRISRFSRRSRNKY